MDKTPRVFISHSPDDRYFVHTRDDFVVYEDGAAQPLLYFSSERVPVSLGLALDTSGSMAGEKIRAAQGALRRFLVDLLGPEDEVFVYRFSDEAVLVQRWTTDRKRLPRLLGGIHPSGETVLYDTVCESPPLAKGGQHRKKALVVISDGNDTGSTTSISEVQRQIRESEILVYAVGIDANAETGRAAPSPVRPRFPPIQLGFPWGGGRRAPGGRTPPRPPLPPAPPGARTAGADRYSGHLEIPVRGFMKETGGKRDDATADPDNPGSGGHPGAVGGRRGDRLLPRRCPGGKRARHPSPCQ